MDITDGPLFGEALKQRREKANLTGQEFADLIGVHLRTVRRWESGGRPQAKYRRKIQEVFQWHEKTPPLMDIAPVRSEEQAISAAVLQAVAQAGCESVPLETLCRLQRIYEECQQPGSMVSFTPQLAQIVVLADLPPIKPKE